VNNISKLATSTSLQHTPVRHTVSPLQPYINRFIRRLTLSRGYQYVTHLSIKCRIEQPTLNVKYLLTPTQTHAHQLSRHQLVLHRVTGDIII